MVKKVGGSSLGWASRRHENCQPSKGMVTVQIREGLNSKMRRMGSAFHILCLMYRQPFCFGSLMVLDVVCGYFLLFLLDIKIESR